MPDLTLRYCTEEGCDDLIPLIYSDGTLRVKSVYDRLKYCEKHALKWGHKKRDRIIQITLTPKDLWLMGKPLNLEYWYI